MRRFSLYLLISTVSAFISPWSAHAQRLRQYPRIGGIIVHCDDASGEPVFTISAEILGQASSAYIDPQGNRIIAIKPSKFTPLPPLNQLMVYAHECGHHMSGDIIARVNCGIININAEKNADRIGIRLLRDQLDISKQQADDAASMFENTPGAFAFYLPGPQRAQWIRDCYATQNDTCTPSSSPPEESPIPLPAQGFCEQFKLITNAVNRSFENLRGQLQDEQVWKGKQSLPGFTQCTVLGRNKHAVYICSTALSSDHFRAAFLRQRLITQVRSCLGSSWQSAEAADEHGTPETVFSKQDAGFSVRAKVETISDDKLSVWISVNQN
jgi:hypothetical protein